jgi:hypothetical protein
VSLQFRLRKGDAMKKSITATFIVIIFISAIWFSYGMGAKSVHVGYVMAYHEPTQRLFKHLRGRVERDEIDLLKKEILLFESEVSKIFWRDENSYKMLVNKVTNSRPKMYNQ